MNINLTAKQKAVLNRLARAPDDSISVHEFPLREIRSTVSALIRKGLVDVRGEYVVLLQRNGPWLMPDPDVPPRTGAIPSPRRRMEIWCESIGIMLDQARGEANLVGVGGTPAFAEVDADRVRVVERLRDNTYDYYNRIINQMKELANK